MDFEFYPEGKEDPIKYFKHGSAKVTQVDIRLGMEN